MSENGRAPYGDGPPPDLLAPDVVVDSRATGLLVESAGWPCVLTGSVNAASARLYAFDWRFMAPADDSLAAVPSDAGVLCLVSLETIDRVDLALDGWTAQCVFGDDPAQIALALADLGATLGCGRAFDNNRAERARLQALALELSRLAEQLGAITSGDDAPADGLAERNQGYRAETSADRGLVGTPDPQRIRHFISLRRLRERFFSPELFADPAWDILLDLAASRIEHRSVSVSSLCIAAAVPPTTALRWIRMMTDRKLLARRADPQDARRMFIDLSDAAFDQVCGWFALVDARGGLGG